jgi:hypothetical protein
VYGWLFPSVVPGEGQYVADEANHVANDLIRNGLDGYFIDPEGKATGNPRN